MILAMENAGQLIEDEELRAQIKGSGIGTSATRAEILKKLMMISYLSLNKKTQVITPTQLGEMIFDVVNVSIRPLLNPELTASWEKGLTFVAEGQITPDEYMQKLEQFITVRTNAVLGLRNQLALRRFFDEASAYYQSGKRKARKRRKQMEQLKISELYQDLNQTLAKELLESKTYPWEVLPLISEFIVKLGSTLSEEEYEKRGENVMGGKIRKSSTDCIYQWTGDYRKRGRSSSLRFYPRKCISGRGSSGWKFYRVKKCNFI